MNLLDRLLGALALALVAAMPALALAQSVPLFQSGTVLSNHLTKTTRTGLQFDVGGLSGDVNGVGVVPFAEQDNLGPGHCWLSGPTVKAGVPQPYWSLCPGHDANGNAILDVEANGGAAAKSIFLNKNGTLYEFPFTLTGIVGPGSSTANHAAVWNNGAGTLTADGLGAPHIRVATNAGLTAMNVAGIIALYGTGVTIIRDDFSAGFGAPPLAYRVQNSACSIASGAGDNGLQVASVDSKCLIAQFYGTADAREWGADPTATADSAPAIIAALAAQALPGSHFCIAVPQGTYKLLSTPNITVANVGCIRGDGMERTILNVNSTSLNGIHVSAAAIWARISDLTVTRTGTPTGNAAGIQVDPGNNSVTIDHVHSTGHQRGFDLGATGGLSWVSNSIAENNLSDGFYSASSIGFVNNQWQYSNDLSQFNSGWGYHEVTTGGGAGTGSNFMAGTTAFANTLGGFGIIATTGNPISDVFFSNVIGSSDGAGGEINVNLMGGTNVQIFNSFFELAGTQGTGPGAATAASNHGQGIFLAGATSSGIAQIANTECYANSESCLAVTAPFGAVQVTGLLSELDNAQQSAPAFWIAGTSNLYASNMIAVAGAHTTYGLLSGGFAQLTGTNFFGGSSGGCSLLGVGPQSENTVGSGCGTAPTVFFPVFACSAGSMPTVSSTSSSYIRKGNIVDIMVSLITSNSGCVAGSLLVPLPFATAASMPASIPGTDMASGKALTGFVAGSSTSLRVNLYDSTSSVAAAASIVVKGAYFTSGQ